MGSLIKHLDNGNLTIDIGYTGVIGYIQDGQMDSPIPLTESGVYGLTGFGSGASLIGAINQLSSGLGSPWTTTTTAKHI